MNPSDESDAARSTWQSQPVDLPRLNAEYVRLQADRWNQQLYKEPRVMLWSAACSAVLAIVYVLLPATVFPGALEQVMALAAAIFTIGYVQFGLRMRLLLTRMRLGSTSETARLLDDYRVALEQRRDLYLENSPWTLWPIVLGGAVLMIGKAVYEPDAYLGPQLIAVIGFITATIFLGRRAAQRKAAELQREIDALDGMAARRA